MRMIKSQWDWLIRNIQEVVDSISENDMKAISEAIDNRELRERRRSFQELKDSNESEEVIIYRPRATYMDGGTQVIKNKQGKKYYIDGRIGSKTKGKVYDRYPGDKGAKIVNIKLVKI